MPFEIRMPELSAEMEEADLVSWLVSPGQRVQTGDVIAEIETDKSTIEFEAPVSGVVLELRVAAGSTGIKVGDVLALIDQQAQGDAPAAAESARQQTPPAPRPTAETAPDAASPPAATALARRIADAAGLDLSQLRGSGSGGRILKADVEARLEPEPEPEPEADAASADSGQPRMPMAPHHAAPHTRMRRTIATRLAEAKRSIPHFYLDIECNAGALDDLRRRLNTGPSQPGLSLNDLFVAAAARALRDVPDANVLWREDALLRFERVDVAVAVATPGGIITPVIEQADRLGLEELSQILRDLVEGARAGTLRPEAYQGGTFTVSNLGMYGVRRVAPIVNPPQSCVLGLGVCEERPVARGGELAVARMVTCTLAADHRALDGVAGARVLEAFRRHVEDPLEMLL